VCRLAQFARYVPRCEACPNLVKQILGVDIQSTIIKIFVPTYVPTEHADESDLTFQAAIAFGTASENTVVAVRAHRVKRFPNKDSWTGHQTLLVPHAMVVFFIFLITPLETPYQASLALMRVCSV
jgi:hypothetical protein